MFADQPVYCHTSDAVGFLFGLLVKGIFYISRIDFGDDPTEGKVGNTLLILKGTNGVSCILDLLFEVFKRRV